APSQYFGMRMPDAAWRLYHDHYHALDPWMGPALASGRSFHAASRLVALDAVRGTEFHADFLRAERLYDDAASVILPLGPGRLGAVAIYTEFGRGAYEDPDLAAIAAATPEIEMFMRLRGRAIRAADAQAFHAARRRIAGGAGPAALLGRDLTVLAADPDFGAAEPGEGEPSPWRVAFGRASLRDPAAQARLAAFAEALGRLDARETVGPGRLAPGLPRDATLLETGARRIEARAVAVSDPAWKLSRLAVLVTSRPSAAAEAARRARALRDIGLTGAEADVAVRLASGASPAEVAAARGASLATVRVQIREAMDKLSCDRQARLVATVLAM
ncbi:MAG: helix-turn-helix transcriptional regulator, partial [Pseudomonadota bacterium]|nr:helix-turn-helix transcriptional regulator [Pseudomonadota bacterium]